MPVQHRLQATLGKGSTKMFNPSLILAVCQVEQDPL